MKDEYLVPLGEVAQFINGRAFKPSEWTTSGLPIIRIQNLTNKEAIFNYYNSEIENKYLINDGDLLVSWSATLDAFIWDRGKAILNQHIFKVIPDTRKIKKTFLFYALKHVMDDLRAQTHGATMKHITRKPFEKTKIYLPSLVEQERIVKLLDEAEALRKARLQASTRMADFVPALFEEMFGNPETNDRNWSTKPLKDLLLKIESGVSPVCLDRPAKLGEWGVLKLGAVTYCEYDSTQNKALPYGQTPRSDIEVKKGDVLFSRKNTKELVAACAFVFDTPPNLLLSDLIFRLRISNKEEILPEYLWQVMIQPNKRKSIQALATGAAAQMPNISKAKLLTVTIPVPPIMLQNEFVNALHKIRDIQAVQTQSEERIEALYQSMLSRAFTGQL